MFLDTRDGSKSVLNSKHSVELKPQLNWQHGTHYPGRGCMRLITSLCYVCIGRYYFLKGISWLNKYLQSNITFTLNCYCKLFH